MRYHVKHETSYSYGSDVVLSHQLLHLVPRPVAVSGMSGAFHFYQPGCLRAAG